MAKSVRKKVYSRNSENAKAKIKTRKIKIAIIGGGIAGLYAASLLDDKNERDFLDYEFARAKAIAWGESAYPGERYICTQRLFAQLFPGAGKSLTSVCDRLVLDSRERDDRHGALLDADMTADALVELASLLEHGASAAPRSWTSE